MPSTKTSVLTLAFAAASLTACDSIRPASDPGTSGSPEVACTRCHGDANRAAANALEQAAPPRSVTGGGGAAHLSHLQGGAFRGPLACTECHVVPTETTHADGRIGIDFGPLAKGAGATPTFAAGTCSGVYCHGATLAAGGTQPAPTWTGGTVSCTSCHGHPPPSHDASSTDCSVCHPGTVKADGTLYVAGGLHINGVVDATGMHPSGWSDPAQHGHAASRDLASCQQCHGADFGGGTVGVSCNACHGGTAWQSNCTFCHGQRVATYTAAELSKAAPPLGTQGETATTDTAVGAHQRHLAGGSIGRAVACAECHATVPTSLAHVNQTASVTFGAAATRGNLTPTWNGASCAATYCHGATVAGGTNKAPLWTGGAAQAACGTCHGAPPPAPHSTSTACGSCHAGYTQTSVNLATHLDGTLDVSAQTCTSCHGDAARASNQPAPPVGTKGETATTTRAVGAHQKHLVGGSIRGAMPCSECHVSPTSTSHSNGTVELAWGTLARTGTTPSWSGAALTCANYCHGATLSGGSNVAPNWTSGSTQAACGTCHGRPPSTGKHGRHSSRSCGDCHPGYTTTSVNPSTHVNGTKQVGNRITSWNATTRQCVGCHGTDTW